VVDRPATPRPGVPPGRRPDPGQQRPGGRAPAGGAGGSRPLTAKRAAWVLGIGALILAGWFLRPAPPPAIRNLDTPQRVIVCLGDSLTAGVGAGPGEDVPARLAALLNRPVVNAGVSGDTTAGALARLPRDVLGLRPGLVVVGLGGNDFLRGGTAAQAEANLEAILRALQGAGAMVVLEGFSFPSLQEDWAGMYRRLAEREACLLVPGLLDGIQRNPELKSDSIHPNAKGYALMAKRLAGPLGKLLKRAGW
jgi:acyl-CoA thioesterase-1